MSACLIVEDSRLARKELVHLIQEIGHFEQIYEADSADQAIATIKEQELDILFLDIHLPGKNGFEILESLDEIPPVIFTTAYDEYAIKSFEYNTIDYLLKPIKKDRLEKAILKYKPNKSKKNRKLENQNQIFIRDGEKCWLVKISDISLLESVGNYTKLHFNDQRAMLQRSLNYLEEVLDSEKYFRVNRQQIINLDHIKNVDAWFSGKLRLVLHNNEIIEVSRRKSQELKNIYAI